MLGSKRTVLSGMVLMGLWGHSALLQAWSGVQTQVELFAYSEPVSIDDFSHDWQGKFYGGTVALTRDRVAVMTTHRDWQLSAIARYDLYTEFHRDTAELYYLNANDLALESGRSYKLDLTAFNLSGMQYRLGHVFHLSDHFSVTVGASLLQATLFQDGQLRGTSFEDTQGNTQFTSTLDYFYTEDKLLARDVDRDVDNYGVSFDLRAQWQATDDLALSLFVDDLFGRVWWRDAPYTKATVTSQVQTTDQDGGIQFNPVLLGSESSEDYTQTLKAYGELALSYQWQPNWFFEADWQHYDVLDFYNVGFGWGAKQQGPFVRFYYAPEIETVATEFGLSWLQFRLGADDMDIQQARVWDASVALQLGF